jgi:hypothetical protein
MSLVSFGDRNRSCCILIESVDDSGTLNATNSGKIGAVCKKSVDKGATFMTRCGMND